MTPRLEILVSTHRAEGLERCTRNNWPRIDGVAYLVSCQYSGPTPSVPSALAGRDDVCVIFTTTNGLSANRNNSLDAARADYLLIADDDTDFHPDALVAIIETFDAGPGLDIVTMRYEDAAGNFVKAYPPDGHDISKGYKGYYTSSVEIALRRSAVEDGHLRFSELAGIGAPYLGQGEEELFVINALRRGLKGRFRAVTVARHPGTSTGRRDLGAPALRARGAVAVRRNPILGWAKIVVRAWRLRRDTPVLGALSHMLGGAVYAVRHRRRL